jgi:hypothetical protein
MAEEQVVNTHKGQKEVIADKRIFLQRAVAALGVVAAAGLTGSAITKSLRGGTAQHARSREEDLRQARIMAGKHLVLMSEDEKQQRLDQILRTHYQTVS